MQSVISRLKQSTSTKVFAIGFLILVLLIPIAMIKGVINERSSISYEAKQDIMRTWGRPQLVAGPVLVLPYELVRRNQRGEPIIEKGRAYVLPERLKIDASVLPEIRYRGLHKVPIYSAEIRLSGSIAKPNLKGLGIDDAVLMWDSSFLMLSVSDARAIAETPDVLVGGQSIRFVPGGEQIGNLHAQISAPLAGILTADTSAAEMPFEVLISVNGTDRLSFLPLGDTTTVTMQSSWASPSFVGSYLPKERTITDTGFSAEWRVSSIGRALPSRWLADTRVGELVDQSILGVNLYMPVSLYRLTLRATKYAILFVGLTFVTYFLFETIAGLRLHPLQYLLIGLSNCLFYLLLISLAEHIGFGWAYVTSSTASCALVVGYSYSVLGTRLRAMTIATILTLLYVFLYMTLKAESYAMLTGSIGLWASLALIMYLTRRIDWYHGKEDAPQSDWVS